MINPINNNGVKKSANEVINGIRNLFGSPPLRNIIIELMNNAPNNMKNKMIIVNIMINVIRKGLIIRIPAVIPIMKPNEINTISPFCTIGFLLFGLFYEKVQLLFRPLN